MYETAASEMNVLRRGSDCATVAAAMDVSRLGCHRLCDGDDGNGCVKVGRHRLYDGDDNNDCVKG